VLVGELLPDRRRGDRWVCLEHRVDVSVQAVQGSGLAVDLFRSGGSAEASALMMVRRPTWCLRSIARPDIPLASSRRIAAYFFRLASWLRWMSSRV
jgi:hypothetical protein